MHKEHVVKEYWLISAPNTSGGVLKQQSAKTGDNCTNYAFKVPDSLRVGTLDALMSLSDDLVKLDLYVENVCRKIARQYFELLEKGETDDARGLAVNGAALDLYLTRFQWDEAKYPTKSTLKELTNQISEEVSGLDEELRNKANEYNQLASNIAAAERKQTGNLLVKGLHDIVKKDDLITSEYLTTLVVVVSKYGQKEWENSYEKLTEYVLPRSSKVIAEDTEFVLVTVTLFRQVVQDFKNVAREKRFTVRDFSYDNTTANVAVEKKKLDTEKDDQQKKLIRWCKVNFAEGFTAWIHLKAVRAFVESVLRFGLPINFQAILMEIHKKGNEKKLRSILLELYKHLGSRATSNEKDQESTEEFYPYVYLNIDLNMKPGT